MKPKAKRKDGTAADHVQEATYRIAEAAHTAPSLEALYEAIHGIIGTLMPARNFYIALTDPESEIVSFVYWASEKDPRPAPRARRKGLTEHVLRTGRLLHWTPAVRRALAERGDVEPHGTPAVDWIGAPLSVAGRVIGALVVQSYSEGVTYGAEEERVLEFVSAQVAMAIERKRTEDALRESEERYRGLFENMQEGLAYCRMLFADGRPRDFVFLAVNAAFARLTGLENVVGRKVSEVIPGILESDPQLFEIYGRVASGGAPERFETQVRALQQWFSISVFSPQDQYFVAVFDLITDRKRTEEDLRRSEAKYRSLVEHAVFGIYRSTLDGQLQAANPALVAMLGYGSEDELLRIDLARDLYVDPGERQRLIARNHDVERIEGVEVEWKRKYGVPIWVRLSGRPWRAPDGTLKGFEMLVEDVTERRILENQLRQAQRMEAIGQLAGGVAHDFNNLLTAVLVSGNLLDSSLPADSPLLDDVKTICDAAQRGAELTQKLLAFSRRQALDLRPVSLGAAAANFVRLARRVVPENVEIVLQVSSEGEAIRADSGALDQILMNLVTNARDAMRGGGKMLIAVGPAALDDEHRRAFGWGRPGAYVSLEVSDTGSGMDADTRRRIFEPFFTTKPVGQGTGLGMSVVYGLIKQHEGFVHVYSEVDQGTTVRLYFPAIPGEGAEPVRPAAPEVRGGTETILLVEDDEAVCRAATRVLERFGYRVMTAADGSEALEILQTCERPPDLIVSDVVMPRTSGPQLLSRLREAGPVPKMLFTSGYTGREVLEHAQLEPGVPVLAKPWTVPDLLRKVREALDAPATT
jgi:PAS domain S-box-containing protein